MRLQPFFAEIHRVVFRQHFEGCSHLIGDPERITALTDAFRRERVAGLARVTVI